ncbi:DNA mismatch repair protein Mlh1 [Hydra vulgaris]|uniref:DNA mismatch repair protein Mlh1 n=1 Tax=Hydra vulgaris TaxID=6087 RepID=UPI001F5F3D50|nr:DNA mismatch repair protein Mlh1-like isoform X1 [Hydra vulgaris]XP_047124404.1 DNA mismatch repair protein Mlh1-like isoform X1 [Hydra vulgaris]XP_047124405.1 DNA mismatch repair protein Mlh1-like isoform X1 [Hydra vulgaris]XP_047124406.1 DNA mismatch repair protein Mlh1-like isoform X1 [Hydra vulgaris]
MLSPKIIKLDEVVVNRIAAGEVIQRPSNAIKEMIENCLDAKSKSIQVTLKNGGLKFIQILDDGCGIRKEDMGIVCERFTTSKLSSFDDLKSINTYGFRGEALASISHVAHLTITSRTADSPCAYKAVYEDGKIVAQQGGDAVARPCAGNKGTQIVVEDLFYNVDVRRKALKNPSEEYNKIADIISKYAIHNPSVSFTLKKFGENTAGIRTQADMQVIDNIKNIYGPTIARELLPVTLESVYYGFKMNGFISNANYSMKKCIFLLFINHRLVECNSLKKAIEAVYQNYLPKEKHPFLYMSLELNPANIDVNVHPTKHEVKFLHEEAIIEEVQKCIETELLGANNSRHYYTQTLLPKLVDAGIEFPVSDILVNKNDEVKKIYDNQLVRTDSRERKIDAFFTTSTQNQSNESITFQCNSKDPDRIPDTTERVSDINLFTKENLQDSTKRKRKISKDLPDRDIKLTSIQNLCKIIDDNEHLGLKNLLEDHKFVGCVKPSLALVQHLTRLYLVNTRKLSEELFYQILIFRFGRFNFIELSSPAPIYDLVMLALDSPQSGWKESDGCKTELAQYVVDLLSSKAEMLLDYFSMEISDKGELKCLPLLLDKYIPSWNGLPMFLLRLGTEVNWDTEQECFETFARECSLFYSFGQGSFDEREDKSSSTQNWKWVVEHVLYTAFRTSLLPTKKFSEDGTFLEVANLPDLYKVFERC